MENTVKKYMVILKKEHKYTRLNLPFEEAKITHPNSIITLKSDSILWSQDKPFTVEQIEEVKKQGFHFQWGFGPCYEKIPAKSVKFTQLETIKI